MVWVEGRREETGSCPQCDSGVERTWGRDNYDIIDKYTSEQSSSKTKTKQRISGTGDNDGTLTSREPSLSRDLPITADACSPKHTGRDDDKVDRAYEKE